MVFVLIPITVPLTVYFGVKMGVVGYYRGMRAVRKLEEQPWW